MTKGSVCLDGFLSLIDWWIMKWQTGGLNEVVYLHIKGIFDDAFLGDVTWCFDVEADGFKGEDSEDESAVDGFKDWEKLKKKLLFEN